MAALQNIPAQPLNQVSITDAELKRIKSRAPTELFVQMRPVVYRANRYQNQRLDVGKFVGSLESAQAYQNQVNHKGQYENPFLATYEMPQGYYMILNSVQRIDRLNEFFMRLLNRRPQDRADIINLHILLRVACGMSIFSTQASFIEGYTLADLDHLKAALQERGVRSVDIAKIFDMESPALKPTRISVYGIDQYMAELAGTYLSGEQEVSPGKRRVICGIITSCRSVNEPVDGTNAMIFANPKSIAVPSEFITLVPLQVLRDEKRATGGTRRKRAKKRKSRRR